MDRATTRAAWPLLLGVAVIGSNSLALGPVVGDVAGELGASVVEVARASAAYGAATALSALLLGRVVDRVGPGRVLVRALVVLALAMVASAAATGWFWLALAQALAGAAAGAALPATYALATRIAPPGRGAEVLGRVLTGWSVSLVAGVPASAAVATAASWRASYALLALLLLAAVWLLARTALPGPAVGERAAPMAEVLRTPGVAALLGVCLLFMTAFYGVYAYLGDHARRVLDLSAAGAGMIVLAYGVGFGLASLGDRALDRLGAARVFAPMLALVSLAYLGMIPAMAGLPALLVVAAGWGAANHFALNILVLRLAGACPEGRGAALALNSAVSYLGATLGAGAFGPLYATLGFEAIAAGAAACAAGAALIAWGLPAARAPSAA
jgi:predicted MFS family arabinose efflux permease